MTRVFHVKNTDWINVFKQSCGLLFYLFIRTTDKRMGSTSSKFTTSSRNCRSHNFCSHPAQQFEESAAIQPRRKLPTVRFGIGCHLKSYQIPYYSEVEVFFEVLQNLFRLHIWEMISLAVLKWILNTVLLDILKECIKGRFYSFKILSQWSELNRQSSIWTAE